MQAPTNSIAIERNGIITIQDADNGQISINTNNATEALNQLQQLNKVQIDSLLQVVDKQQEQPLELFNTLLKGIASEKNVVKGSISNVEKVKIGDEFHYHYHYHSVKPTVPKELTLSIPKICLDDIIGREEDLEELHELLNKGERVVNGLGGIGKTTLAQAYMTKYYEEYKHIAWISQTSENIIVDFISERGLMRNLSIEIAGLKIEETFGEIIRKLKGIEDKPNLLIINNGEQSLSRYRSMIPSWPQWHLLITSRENITGFQSKSLGFLSEGSAIGLFKKHYHPLQELTDRDIKELVRAVDYHTLTIEI